MSSRQRIPRALLWWGFATLFGDLALLAVTFFLIAWLYRSGAWTRAEVNVWGPIIFIAVALLSSAISLLMLWRVVLPKLGPPPAPM